MSELLLGTWSDKRDPITVDAFLRRFDAVHFERIETRDRRIAETFEVPTITSEKEFMAPCVGFHAHYENTRWTPRHVEPERSFGDVWEYFERFYGCKGVEWWDVARMAITGHNGGFPAFLHDVTAAMVKKHIDDYIADQFCYYFPSRYGGGDEQKQVFAALLDDLLSRFGPVPFFPDDPYISLKSAHSRMDGDGPRSLEPRFKALILRLRGLQQQLQF